MIKQYTNSVIMQFNENYNGKLPLKFKVKPRIWYNPELKSVYYMVPGIMVLLVTVITVLLTALAIVRERGEKNTLEQLMVTPIGRVELILGKTIYQLPLGKIPLIAPSITVSCRLAKQPLFRPYFGRRVRPFRTADGAE